LKSVLPETLLLLSIIEFKKMNITLFITEDCSTCLSVQKKLMRLLKDRNDVNLLIEDIKSVRSNGIVVAPAIFIGDELFSYGEFEKEKLLKLLVMK